MTSAGSDEPERAPDGTELLRYDQRVPGAEELSHGDGDLIDAVTGHVEQHLGVEPTFFHELVSPTVHVDLLLCPATDSRPYQVVVTCGMAELPMRPPDDEVADLTHSELFVLLPPDWPLEQEALQDEANYWPLRILKQLARLPHEYDSWIWTGHTVPNGDPPSPYAEGTELCCALVTPALEVPDGFALLERPEAAPIHFHTLLPLYREEMELKLAKGLDALFERLDAAAVDPVIDPRRASAVGGRRRKRFGLF